LIHDDADDVGVAVVDVAAGSEVVAVRTTDGKEVELRARDDIPLGHKIALRDIDEGHQVLKYGTPIGLTTNAIAAGDYVHTHNLRTARW
jgi:(2R)-sulfolactate sulfo-lyase subunit alpha